MKEGEKFEHLAVEVFSKLSEHNDHETIEHDVMLEGPDGPRQIDVLLTGKVGPFEVKTIIECKDYSKNVNVIAIDALHSKLLDVKAQKAVLVARKGFTKGAKSKAKRLGISICTLHSMEHEKWKLETEMPIVITEYSCEKYTPSLMFKAITSEVVFKDFLTINDIPITKIVADYWNDNEIACKDGLTKHTFIPDLPKPNWVYVPDGREMEVTNLSFSMSISKKYYFGFINNMKSAKLLDFIGEERKQVLFDPNDLSDYRETMTRYSKIGGLPELDGALKLNIKLLQATEVNLKFA